MLMPDEKKIGYEIAVETPNEGIYVFCVDEKGKTRGFYADGCRHYMSDFELWSDHDGFGQMSGKFENGGEVSAYKKDGRIFDEYGYRLEKLKVVRVITVDIARAVSDQYVAGIDRPIWQPGSLN